jgi:hypothetical protein
MGISVKIRGFWGVSPCTLLPSCQHFRWTFYTSFIVECVWNLMAHVDARYGEWRGNWRMEWVASTLTLLRSVVYPALLPLLHTRRLPVNWTDAPRRFKWTLPFRRKTKSGFCSCAIRFQTSSTHFTYFYEYVQINCFFLISVHIDPEEEDAMLPETMIKRLPHNTVSSQKTALRYYLIFYH